MESDFEDAIEALLEVLLNTARLLRVTQNLDEILV